MKSAFLEKFEFGKNLVFKQKTTNQIIKEIHEDFFTEVDKLLAEAKISRSLETTKQDLINKSERLKKLGFVSTKEVSEAQQEMTRIRKLEEENKLKIDLICAIDYFSMKYPQYKFITEESVKTICQKYGLIYGGVDKYKGVVPEKNLKQMEDFKIDQNDQCCLETRTNYHYGGSSEKTVLNYHNYKIKSRDGAGEPYSTYHRYDYTICPLEIAGPVGDFNTQNMNITDYKLEQKIQIPDPVVLQPVFYRNKKYYLIVTAWGLEASDEIVVNQKMN